MITSILIFVIVALTIGLWVIDCDGLIKIEWLGYDIEVNTIFTLFIVAVVFFCIVLLVKLIFFFLQCVYNCRRRWRDKKIILLEQGHMYLNCGDVEKVEICVNKLGNFQHPSLFLLKGKILF
ncbi:MAG: hypothetical protein ACTJLM_03130 [Ehrlichia sp.]